MARAIEIRWRCPPESWAPRAPRYVPKPSGSRSTNSAAAAAAKNACRDETPEAPPDLVQQRRWRMEKPVQSLWGIQSIRQRQKVEKVKNKYQAAPAAAKSKSVAKAPDTP